MALHLRYALPIVAMCAACSVADEESLRGAVGESCNGRDDDCRSGLVCELGRCASVGPQARFDCDAICGRLGECEASEDGCASDCRITVEDWSVPAKDAFGTCLVEDLSCAEATEAFAPQTCYSRIPVPTARRERCDGFVVAARGCGADVEVLERILEGCVAVARVSAASRWEETERCASAVETGVCPRIATCFNAELELEPAISLGN